MTGGIYRPETDGALLAMVNVYKTFPVRKSFFAGEDLRVRAVSEFGSRCRVKIGRAHV